MGAQSSSDEQKWKLPMPHSVLKYLNPLKKVMFLYYDTGVILKIPIWL